MIEYGYLRYGSIPANTVITVLVTLPAAYTVNSFSQVVSPTMPQINGTSGGDGGVTAFKANFYNPTSTQLSPVNFRYITIGY